MGSGREPTTHQEIPSSLLEESGVVALINQLRPGLAIDIAAGTGRHARRLAPLGHRVLAVDSNADRLARLPDVAGVTTAVRDITAPPALRLLGTSPSVRSRSRMPPC